MPPKGKISYINQDEPSFIKQFKQKIAYKEGPTIDTKLAEITRDSDEEEQDDEKPTVVVLRKGDLSKEEVERLRDEEGVLECVEADSTAADTGDASVDSPPADGRIIFKKPSKRQKDSDSNVQSSSKKLKSENKTDSKKSSIKQVKNSSLLSFGDDVEEDDV